MASLIADIAIYVVEFLFHTAIALGRALFSRSPWSWLVVLAIVAALAYGSFFAWLPGNESFAMGLGIAAAVILSVKLFTAIWPR